MRAVTIDSDLATLFTFTPRKPPITPIQGVPGMAQEEPLYAYTLGLAGAICEMPNEATSPSVYA